jgi:acyl carrier protein
MTSVFGNENGGSSTLDSPADPVHTAGDPLHSAVTGPIAPPDRGAVPESSAMSDQTTTIRQVLADHGRLSAAVDSLGDADSLFDAGLSSHAAVNVMLALEDHFDVEFPERFLKRATFDSVASLQDALTEILA